MHGTLKVTLEIIYKDEGKENNITPFLTFSFFSNFRTQFQVCLVLYQLHYER